MTIYISDKDAANLLNAISLVKDVLDKKFKKVLENVLDGKESRNEDRKAFPQTPFPKERSKEERKDEKKHTKACAREIFDIDGTDVEIVTLQPDPRNFEGSAALKPPTLDEIRSAMNQMMIKEFSAENFYYFYEAQGWLRSNGKPMYNWLAELRNWQLNELKNPNLATNGHTNTYNGASAEAAKAERDRHFMEHIARTYFGQ